MNLNQSQPSDEDAAIQNAVAQAMENPDVHTAYYGRKNGDGAPCIVCVVKCKLPISRKIEHCIPRDITVRDGYGSRYGFKTDVVEGPEVNAFDSPPLYRCPRNYVGDEPRVAEDHKRCHSPLIYGGAQIAPRGARWVGTLGAAILIPEDEAVGILSNWHVLIGEKYRETQGTPICQPHGNAGEFGQLHSWGRILFNDQNANNKIDAAIAVVSNGKTYNCVPEQIDIGKLNPNPVREYVVGTTVKKTGRTTGATTGRIVGTHAQSAVNYGQSGTAHFVDQLIIEGDRGQFSDAGDSGSLILTEDNRPIGLLFAGGGGQTIANPIAHIIDELKIKFF